MRVRPLPSNFAPLWRSAISLFLTGCLMFAYSDMAWAGPLDSRAAGKACKRNPGGKGPSGTRYDAYSPADYNILIATNSTFIIPVQPIAGTVLLSGEHRFPFYMDSARGRAAALYDCPYGTAELFMGNGNLVPGMPDVYQTSIRGIGYRVYYYLSDSDQATAPAVFSNPYQNGVMIFPLNGPEGEEILGPNIRTRIELIATGEEIAPGTITAGSVFAQVTSTNGNIGGLYRVGLRNNIVVSQPTCVVSNTAALTVTLPDLPVTQLMETGVGPQTDFSLQVSCNAARNDAPAITLTTNAAVPSMSGTLANQLSGGSAAVGIGAQLLLGTPSQDYSPMEFGVANKGTGTAIGALPSTNWRFDLGARFVMVGNASAVKAGDFRGTGTVTFTYN